MASELKVNTLTGVSTAGSIAVTAEGNSTTTNLQQGLVKMWAHFDTSGDDNIDDSFNVASKTDNATGDHYMNFTNNMASVSYVGHHDGNENAVGNTNFYGSGVRNGGYATSSLRLFLGYDPGTVTGTDVDSQACAAHGDLA
tara:strand:- start:26 stop:448 length:423 start_codon:yes stop_codon:yes gene_type:complete